MAASDPQQLALPPHETFSACGGTTSCINGLPSLNPFPHARPTMFCMHGLPFHCPGLTVQLPWPHCPRTYEWPCTAKWPRTAQAQQSARRTVQWLRTVQAHAECRRRTDAAHQAHSALKWSARHGRTRVQERTSAQGGRSAISASGCSPSAVFCARHR